MNGLHNFVAGVLQVFKETSSTTLERREQTSFMLRWLTFHMTRWFVSSGWKIPEMHLDSLCNNTKAMNFKREYLGAGGSGR